MTMDLLDRYLHAVDRALLPMSRSRRSDIVQELRENLSAQVHDLQAQAGRALAADEVEAVLRGHGHPMTIAARYRDRGSARRLALGWELVGIELFAWYEVALAIGVGGTLFVTLIAALVIGAPITLRTLLPPLLLQLSAQTLVFITLNRYLRPQLRGDWRPADLPPISDALRVSRGRSLTEIALIVAFLSWWLGWIGPGLRGFANSRNSL